MQDEQDTGDVEAEGLACTYGLDLRGHGSFKELQEVPFGSHLHLSLFIQICQYAFILNYWPSYTQIHIGIS